jgi:hypothetical protein
MPCETSSELPRLVNVTERRLLSNPFNGGGSIRGTEVLTVGLLNSVAGIEEFLCPRSPPLGPSSPLGTRTAKLRALPKPVLCLAVLAFGGRRTRTVDEIVGGFPAEMLLPIHNHHLRLRWGPVC